MKIFFSTLCLLLILTFSACTSSPQNTLKTGTDQNKTAALKTNTPNTVKDALPKKLETNIDSYSKEIGFSGNIFVAKGGEILLNKSYGFSDFEHKTLNTNDTRFLVGSLTKQFTAMAIMQLEEKGLLSVEDKINKYIDGFPEGDKITIHHLLTHTSGLPQNIELKPDPSLQMKATDFKNRYPTAFAISLKESIDLEKKQSISFLFAPGEVYSYSNAGYYLLGYIIEKASGMSYEDYMVKNILNPLKMTNSGFGFDRRSNKLLALGYIENNESITKNSFIDMAAIAPAGGLYSTINDLYKWDRALYKYDLISKKSMDKIFDGGKFNYGYGWMIEKENGKRIYSHTGLVYGFTSEITRMVDEDTCIIILSNVDDHGTNVDNLDFNIKSILKS
ncbi:MAG TPA: serine hydrolase domain-containing protein [Clostridia bacterium]